MPGIYPLKGVIKHYDWGGNSFIPSMLQHENPGQLPFAEYWMGTHPVGMALVKTTEGEKELISLTGLLSFLFKVLDVKDMLSIQVHPSKQAAEKAFARENAEGIPLHSPQRNYRDANHKPELMVALGDFWLLHGFKPAEELVYTLLNVTELRELLPVFNQSGYAGLYKHIMEMPQAEVNRILQPLIHNLSSVYQNREPDRYDEDFWAAKAANLFTKNGNIDRGIFSIYLFNLVHLKEGEGIFQGAGVPHTYLEGRNVEIMASSDNVLRGGLTTKHIDVKELMKHVKCEAVYPEILTAENGTGSLLKYKVPVSDFVLEKTELAAGDTINLQAESSEILLVTEGEVQAGGITLKPGQPSAIVLAGTDYTLKGVAARTVVFRAGPGC
ncbi:MAG: mannose-6-phosphate isomerase, class I [Bacteroidetes bacterium]|nr:mannose-6-phosphate isomerase, class I [Bacteroidota bacterium]